MSAVDVDTLAGRVREFAGGVRRVQERQRLVGTERDSVELRAELRELVGAVKRQGEALGAALADAEAAARALPESSARLRARASVNKLKDDFVAVQEQLGAVHRQIARAPSPPAPQDPVDAPRAAEAGNDGAPGSPLAGRLVYVDAERLEAERREMAAHLESETAALAEAFRDFNEIVADQQQGIDHIEKEMHEASVNVEKGTKDLAKAARYSTAGLSVLGAIAGGIVAGPIGAYAGAQGAGLALTCVAGVVGGGYGGRKVAKTKRKEADKVLAEMEEEREMLKQGL